MRRIHQEYFWWSPSNNKQIKHHINALHNFSDDETHELDRFILRSKHLTPSRYVWSVFYVRNGLGKRKLRGSRETVFVREEGASTRKLRAILQTSSMSIWFFTDTSKIRRILVHVGMTHARWRPKMEVVCFLSDVHQAFLLWYKILFCALWLLSKAPCITRIHLKNFGSEQKTYTWLPGFMSCLQSLPIPRCLLWSALYNLGQNDLTFHKHYTMDQKNPDPYLQLEKLYPFQAFCNFLKNPTTDSTIGL